MGLPEDCCIQHTVSHFLGLPVPPAFLLDKLSQAEDSKRALEATVQNLQLRLLDLEHRLTKSKEEASMNAIALRKQVMENQNLEMQMRQASQRCVWLEEECSLYYHDREMFLGVAEEAEDKACNAEEKCGVMEKKMAELLAEIDVLKTVKVQAEGRCAETNSKMAELLTNIDVLKNAQIQHAQTEHELERLGLKVQQLETANSNLQDELSKAEQKCAHLQRSQDACMRPREVTCAEDAVFGSNARDHMANKERPGTHQLMAEVQRLWKEVALYKCDLARAEIQVRILDDDNKDLRLALRNRNTMSSSPACKKGKTNSSLFDSVGIKNTACRHPLGVLESNILNLR